jgi:hypothetical protein
MEVKNRATRLVFATLLLATLASSANAYIDGGSGSYLMQVAIAGILGGAFTLKSYWAHVKSFVVTRVQHTRTVRR